MFFLPLLGSCSPSLGGGGGDTDVSSVDDHPSAAFSQHVNKFLVCIAAHCRKSLPLWRMRTPYYRHKHKEGDSATCTCQKAMVVDFLARAYDFPKSGLLTRFTIPGTDPLLWSRPQIQSESSWFLP